MSYLMDCLFYGALCKKCGVGWVSIKFWFKSIKAQEELGIPVLDPVLIGFKMAEFRATLWKKFGISHSKVGGYESPPYDELAPIYKKVYGKTP